MAGHSKWNNIKNRKGAADSKRAKEFAQISKLIRIAVQQGKSGDLKGNPALKVPLEKARAANMPKDKIQRAIDTGLGKRNGVAVQDIVYEAFGPGGVGLLVHAMTDNPQRTSAEMKFILSRNGGTLSGPGSVMYMFTRNEAGDGYEATMRITLEDPDTVLQLQELVDQLETNEDVEEVFHAGEWLDPEEG